MDEKNLYLESLKHRNYDMYKYFKRGLDMIATLKEKTYEAYIVGGVVRDFVLNVDFNDIDNSVQIQSLGTISISK